MNFGGKVCFLARPFLNIPTQEEWQTLLDRIVSLRSEHGIDLPIPEL